MASLTAANSVFVLGIAGLYPSGVLLQGYDVDDALDSEAVESSEVKIGVDGIKSAGWLPTLFKQTIALQADSPSIDVFDAWFEAQQQARELYAAFGTITIPGLSLVYTLNNGTLGSYTRIPPAKKILQPRKFTITWQTPVRMPY